VYGVKPTSEDILKSLIKISERLQHTKWNIEIPERGEKKIG
jgi:hypothetical protein